MADSAPFEHLNDPEDIALNTPIAGVAGAAMIIMFGNVLSRALGMVREQLAAGLFGTGDRIAAFTVADNVHTLLFDLLISGMLQAALVPVLAQWSAPADATRRELRRISGALLVLAVAVVGTMTAIGVLFAPTVVRIMTSLGGQGQDRGAATTELTVTLVRIILPAVFFLAIGVVLMAILYSLGRMTAPSLSIGFRNATIVAAIAFLSSAFGVKSMALGVVAGAIVIVGMQIPPLRRANALPILNIDFRQEPVRRVLALYGPIFVGLLLNTVAVVVDRNLAWGAEEDALGAMRYATTLVQLILGLVAAAISLAALPTLSRHFAQNDEPAFLSTLGKALAMVTVLIVPAVFGLAAISSPVVDLLFRHGETTHHGAHLIVVALLGYLPGTLFAAYDQVLIFAFYARQDTKTPVVVGVVAIGVYFAVAIALIQPLGMLGLVIANSCQFISHALIMFWLARKNIGPIGAEPLKRVARSCLIAGVVMTAASLAFWLAGDEALPAATATLARLVRDGILVLGSVGLGAIVYVALLHRFGVSELAALRRAVLGRISPRLAGSR